MERLTTRDSEYNFITLKNPANLYVMQFVKIMLIVVSVLLVKQSIDCLLLKISQAVIMILTF